MESSAGALTTTDATYPADAVEVRVAAKAEQTQILRTIAASVAILHDFDLEAVEDFRMAVQEACAVLIPFAELEARLDCRFVPGRHEITAEIAVPCRQQVVPTNDRYSWALITALTAKASCDFQASPGGGGVVRMAITCARQEVTAP